ncbi:MAG TPA: uracil-DNA glycosylase family protein [Azospirillum sp.]|nr:uracil-DNA glycosylase family protein [Azospirillum sp.]
MEQGIRLEHPSDIEGGLYDCPAVHTWSMWQDNLNTDIAIVGEYWGTVSQFIRQRGENWGSNPGTRYLVDLLATRNYRISLPEESKDGMDAVFVTNAVLCMQCDDHDDSAAHWERANNCSEHLRNTLAPISPPKIVALGPYAFYGVLLAYRQRVEAQQFRDRVERVGFGKAAAAVWKRGGVCLDERAWVYPMYNPGGQWGIVNRPMKDMIADWSLIPQKGALPPGT